MAKGGPAVVIVDSGGLPVTQVVGGGNAAPFTVVTSNGFPVTLVSTLGTAVALYNVDGSEYSGVSLTAPVLTWVSAADDNTPLFEGLFTDLLEGDVGRLQISDDVGFSSPIEATNTADAAEALALQLDYTSGALADGQWWARVRHERGASVSAWSNVETETIVTVVTPPSVVTTSVGNAGAGGGYASAPLPSGISAGDLLILVMTQILSPAAPTMTTPATYALLDGSTQGFTRLSIYWKIASGSEGTTISTSASGGRPGINAFRITGHNASQAPEATFTQNSVDPPNLTPSWGAANNLWITGIVGDSGGNTSTPTYPTGYTDNQLITASSNGDGAKVVTATKAASATSDNPSAFATNLPTDPIAFTLAIRPA